MDLEGKWKAILVGGAISGLAPFIPVLNLTCCLIPFAGAVIAVAIYSGSPESTPLENRDGIVLGAMSGLVGTALYAVLIIPLVFIVGNTVGGFLGDAVRSAADLPQSVRPLVESLLANFGGILVFIVLLKILSQLALSLLFGILGGIVGVALFRRNTPAANLPR